MVGPSLPMILSLLEGTIFSKNEAQSGGGALATDDLASAQVSDAIFIDNKSLTGTGGAIHMQAPLIMTHTQVISNSAAAGGGVFALNDTTITNGHFEGNKVPSLSGGGGLAVGGNLTLRQSTFIRNAAFTGAGVLVEGKLQLNGNRFEENIAVEAVSLAATPRGVGNRLVNNLWLDPNTFGVEETEIIAFNRRNDQVTPEIEMLHNTIANPERVKSPALTVGAVNLTFENNIMANYEIGFEPEFESVINSAHNLFFGVTPSIFTEGNDNFSGEPQFEDPIGRDFRLQASSPARDAGPDVGVAVDFDGAPRPSGLRFDLGAYELQVEPPSPAPTPTPNPEPSPDDGFTFYLPLISK